MDGSGVVFDVSWKKNLHKRSNSNKQSFMLDRVPISVQFGLPYNQYASIIANHGNKAKFAR